MHGPHHTAQKSSSTTLPLRSLRLTGLPLSAKSPLTFGAGFPIRSAPSAFLPLLSSPDTALARTTTAVTTAMVRCTTYLMRASSNRCHFASCSRPRREGWGGLLDSGRVAPGITPWRSRRSVLARLRHTARPVTGSFAAVLSVSVTGTEVRGTEPSLWCPPTAPRRGTPFPPQGPRGPRSPSSPVL